MTMKNVIVIIGIISVLSGCNKESSTATQSTNPKENFAYATQTPSGHLNEPKPTDPLDVKSVNFKCGDDPKSFTITIGEYINHLPDTPKYEAYTISSKYNEDINAMYGVVDRNLNTGKITFMDPVTHAYGFILEPSGMPYAYTLDTGNGTMDCVSDE